MICHAKKKNLPAVSLQFVKRVGVWPRVLVSDGAGEIIDTKLQRQLLARSCKYQVAARGAITGMSGLSVLFRESIPFTRMGRLNVNDSKSKTIFEIVYWFVHDLVSLSPIDCLA